MTFDKDPRSYITFSEAGRNVPGKGVRPETIARWAFHGTKGGIRLRSYLVAGRRFTTLDDLKIFLSAVAASDGKSAIPAGPTDHQVQSRSRAADAVLASRGI